VSAANSAAIAAFGRQRDGALTQLPGDAGCVGGYHGPAIPGSPGGAPLVPQGCTRAALIHHDISLSRDGRHAYAPEEDGIFVYARNGPRIRLRISRRRCGRSGPRVHVTVSTYGRLRRATVRLDRRAIRTTARPRFSFTIERSRLATRRRHRLSVLATDARGRSNDRAARIGRCPRAV